MLLWWWGLVASTGSAGSGPPAPVYLPVFAFDTNAVIGLPASQAK